MGEQPQQALEPVYLYPEAPDERPWPGRHCTVCRNGILIAIGETDEGFYLACFNCDTRGTVHKTDPWVASVPAGENVPTTPSGFTVSNEQARIQDAGGDPEAAAAASRRHPTGLAADERAGYDARIAELQRQLNESQDAGPATKPKGRS